MSKVKISIAQALALLTAAGAPVAEIVIDEKDATPDTNTDTLLSDIDTARTAVIRPKIEGEVKEQVKSAVAGKAAGVVRSVIKRKFGITEEDLKGLQTEEEMIAKGLEIRDAKYGKDTEELRKEITRLSEDHAKTLQEKEDGWKKKVQEAEDRYTERDIDEYLSGIVKEIPRTGGSELAQARQLKQHLRETHHLVWNAEKKKLELRQKDNIEKPAYNESGNQLLEAKDVAVKFLEEMGVAAKDQRHVNPVEAMNRHTGTQNADTRGTDAGNADPVAAHLDRLMMA